MTSTTTRVSRIDLGGVTLRRPPSLQARIIWALGSLPLLDAAVSERSREVTVFATSSGRVLARARIETEW